MGDAARKLAPVASIAAPPHLRAVDPALWPFVRALAAVIAADLQRRPPGQR